MDQILWLKCLFFSFRTLLILLSFLGLASSAPTTPASCHADQRSALLQLKEGFIDSNLTSWQPGTDCCHGWDGVSCNETTGHVTTLDLSSYNIEGNLSVAIFNLTSLQHLNLAYNNFLGNHIPYGFERLTQLTHLNLSSSRFSGQIPIGIDKLTKLISLDLSHNKDCNWYGDCNKLRLHEPSLCTLISKLDNLRELHLDDVNLSENGTEWCGALSDSVPLLQVLSMSFCNLSGPFEPSLSRLHYLTKIDLSWNNFQCPLPDYFSNFPLKHLDLLNSNLIGSFPHKIFQIPTLIALDISYNADLLVTLPDFLLGSPLESMELYFTNLLSPIPYSIGNLLNLSYLDISLSNLSGQIPSSIGKLVKLNYLDLDDNSLSGSIPQSLFALPNLEILDLSYNKLSGQFNLETKSFISYSPLTDLNLNNNHLTGSIPRAIYKLSNLEGLHLSDNQFSGPIPNSIFGLPSLQVLKLANNNFNETFKLKLLQYLSNLTSLSISNNQLSLEDVSDKDLLLSFPRISYFGLASCNLSQIPRLLRYHDSLVAVDLSENHLHGVIPSWIGKQFRISSSLYRTNYESYLDLSANKLTREIPSSMCEVDLYYLDLSRNKLSGLIPSCLFEAPSLNFLNLSANQFQGILHHNIEKSCQLFSLDLSYNGIFGELPKLYMRCMNLVVLNMENNHIADTFPFFLGNIPTLQVLILKSNQLHGTLEPPSKWASNNSLFQNLRILDLASNNFHGSLPPLLFQHLRSMFNSSLYEMTTDVFDEQYIYPDNRNDFGLHITNKGIQMKLGFTLASLIVEIDLSRNRFSGEICNTIGNLSELRVLNLSHNVFTGHIPRSFKGLDHIESLDLSWNNLSGEIPQELTSLDSLTTINLSFNHLVGRIPQSPHFSTFGNLSYEGNPGLCGMPLSKLCEASSPTKNSTFPSASIAKNMKAIVFLCLFVGLGFGTGFAIAILYPVIKRAKTRSTTR